LCLLISFVCSSISFVCSSSLLSQREVALDIYDRFFRANHAAGGAPDAGAAASTAAVCSFVAPAALAAIHALMGQTRCGVRVSDDLPVDR
jgi:hypothetical protein